MASSGLTLTTPPVFNGNNYQMWVVKMKTFMMGCDIWEPVTGRIVNPLPRYASLNQQARHAEEVAKTHRALACIFVAVTEEVFSRIMTCTTAKQAWDKLQK
ncbi:unnamed protein product [Linum trigynum]|uniref:DUF4219 domain-containing protein n=1 Tax=Linum trigynum TaxID=586398 RepID=A0AAV2FT64_9ROSI